MTGNIGRRQFLFAIGGAAFSWPHGARAQQPSPAKRIGVLMAFAEDDLIIQAALAAFLHGLNEVGWQSGRNLRIEYRWAAGSVERARQAADELIALKPDLIFASTTPVIMALKRTTSTIPIVFIQVSDPVGAGFVDNLARPGGNITGFINFEDTMGGKWLELLKEVAPAITHTIIMFNPDTAPGAGGYFLPSFETAAHKLGVTPNTAPVHNQSEIEAAIRGLAAQPGGGLVVMSDSFMLVHFEQIRKLAETYKLPAIYGLAARARQGALMTYAPDTADIYGKSAAYVDRVLKGESPSNLPVQVPTKFELMINLKTAKALGLTVPQTLLATADEVIE